ncbi:MULTISPECIES: bifunctional 2-polyprenyl-6-hydroxyphenol methylase/3-demethylubiquinol 3-O-methyltransferase UbiG [Aquincola]|uniref:class I SAM-dependent methyltransferase n=1 Tax=Aquincola TaxID=391952 RepID=UPI0006152DD7|nr:MULTISPECIES: class I SAM-dependent methyltransferase [Aquincola]MCR5869261.1 class I SAM-dependent methyltransferase [Aquincola sp. J276]
MNSAAPANYYDGLNQKLLDAIPTGARKVLELGCANGRLGRRFKELHPGAQWHGIDLSAEAVATAAPHLDSALRMDLDHADFSVLEGGYDTIVIGDLLEHLRDPAQVLDALYDISADDARIVCCVPNMAHISVIQRMLSGDLSYDPNGLLDQTHVRFFSPPSLFKLFLDSAWLPHLQDQYRFDLTPSPFVTHVLKAAEALGLPLQTAVRNLDCYQMIVVAAKWPMQQLIKPGKRAQFSVIVPVNRIWQAELNIARSPGLIEAAAQLILVEADSAAEAYAKGAAQARHPWRVLAHQDVYFPRGTGYALSLQLGALEEAGLAGAPVGFVGLSQAADGSRSHSGVVVDRRHLLRNPPTQSGITIDELAVCLHAKSKLAIDPHLGWHLWGTDLCLQAEERVGQPIAQILDVPVFHNSVGDYDVPPAFHESARVLLAKYPHRASVVTLMGELVRKNAAKAA